MANDALTTTAEKSGFRKTGRIDEVERLCVEFARTWPKVVRVVEFGRSAEGRPMLALAASRVFPREGPVLLVQGGIHPGESDGKDAGFIALREILEGEAAPGALDRITILFVPAFNVDGHERFGRWNRPNQNGPEEMGWRTTAQNLNLNRDYTKAESPEMQAMLRLVTEWDPLVMADLHVTDGADFEPDVSIQVEPIHQGNRELRTAGLQLRDGLVTKLEAQGSLPIAFYPDLFVTDDPASGFHLTVYSPRFSTGYFPARNRFTVLVELHSWKPYKRRIQVMRNCVVDLAELVVEYGATWQSMVRDADAATCELARSEVVLDYASGWREPTRGGAREALPHDANATMIEFPGYAYTREPSPISGALVTRYDPKTPKVWSVPYRHGVKPSLVVRAPAGYIVPAGFATLVGDKLRLHGISCITMKTALSQVEVEAFRASSVSFSAAPFEGRTRARIEGEWTSERNDFAAGSLWVPTTQPLGRLVMALLEPRAPDSLAAWGFFNACFEQKEYVEPYVADQIAREMLAKDPALRAEFERRLKEDAEFAASPAARLEFFLRRHASWDPRHNLYPVARSLSAPEALSG